MKSALTFTAIIIFSSVAFSIHESNQSITVVSTSGKEVSIPKHQYELIMQNSLEFPPEVREAYVKAIAQKIVDGDKRSLELLY